MQVFAPLPCGEHGGQSVKGALTRERSHAQAHRAEHGEYPPLDTALGAAPPAAIRPRRN